MDGLMWSVKIIIALQLGGLMAAALGFSLVMGHPFVDGNKRTGHAAMETFLVLNGNEVSAPVDEQERVMLQLASGELSRDAFVEWVRSRTLPRR